MLKTFRINWIKPESGGGCEDILAKDMLECLKAFYEKWQDVGKYRFVISIEEIE